MKFNCQTFEYQDKILMEKAIIKPPYKKEGVFQNQGCFLYMKGAKLKVLSSDDNIQIANKESVLLKCNTYFLDWVEETENEEVEVIAIHLYPEILKKSYGNELPSLIEKQVHNVEARHIADEAVIARFVESLDFYFQNPSLVNNDLLEIKIRELVLLLVQTKNVESVLELISDLYSSRTVNLKKVMDLHVYSNLSLEELAKLSNMSLSSFKREFKKQFNDSPSHYISTEKLKKAKELLTISNLSISEIAYDVGFNDPLYFTRLFKKREGTSPSAYRAAHTS